ncbi:hypothetical protein ACJ72_01777 [Emergomyces africanus]|uniref:Uncharacterized protein n=1 Tax=Emergomyces africanus TaxID=1955775 RepID=A0A1B7P4Q6_9EURO|nr:hypothetical protein ACJ72_01777 [Emergomyces africanus]
MAWGKQAARMLRPSPAINHYDPALRQWNVALSPIKHGEDTLRGKRGLLNQEKPKLRNVYHIFRPSPTPHPEAIRHNLYSINPDGRRVFDESITTDAEFVFQICPGSQP